MIRGDQKESNYLSDKLLSFFALQFSNPNSRPQLQTPINFGEKSNIEEKYGNNLVPQKLWIPDFRGCIVLNRCTFPK